MPEESAHLEKIQAEINYLKKELLTLEKKYYQGKRVGSDEVYDVKLRKLLYLEEEYPQFQTPDSPTQNIGKSLDSGAPKLKHDFAMLSLNNAFNQEELQKFLNDIAKEKEGLNCFLEPKIDGVSISIIYKNNFLHQAISRGDGLIGDDLTEKVKKIDSIPLHVADGPGNFIIRGEIFITKNNFAIIQSQETQSNSDLSFSNPRNYAAGSLRLKNSDQLKNKKLEAIFYCLFLLDQDQKNTFLKQSEIIEKFRQWNIPTHSPKNILLSSDAQEIFDFLDKFKEFKNDWEIPNDGIVVKVDDQKEYEEIGYTTKFPKWAIAYKYPSTIAQTKLLDIEISVGRSGRITYVGNLEPVEINGTTIKNATLHNWDNIEKLDLKKHDIVQVYKSGEIIPQIIGYVPSNGRDKLENFKMFTHCPSCNSELTIKNFKIQFCQNNDCLEKKIAQFTHFAARDAMDIHGFSQQLVKKFHKIGLLNNISDIYKLKDHKETILAAKLKIQEKAFNNMVKSIEKSKDTPQEHVLFSLGINQLGLRTAKLLLNKFLTIENVLNSSQEDITAINGIGNVLYDEILLWKAMPENQLLLSELKNLGIIKTFSEQSPKPKHINSYLYQKSIVITGTLKKPRNEISNALERKYGALIKKEVTKNVDYLLVGENPGSKLNKAKELNIPIINEDDFYQNFEI